MFAAAERLPRPRRFGDACALKEVENFTIRRLNEPEKLHSFKYTHTHTHTHTHTQEGGCVSGGLVVSRDYRS